MELKKTPLQNLKDILLDADSQADRAAQAAGAHSDQAKAGVSTEDEKAAATLSPQPVENYVENIAKRDILLKISQLEKIGNTFQTNDELYAVLRPLWDPDTP